MHTINTDVFNGLKAMMSDIMPELVAVFFEDSDKLLQEIQAGIDAQNQDVVLKATHTLKSSAKNMGAEKLAGYCVDIEQSIEKQGIDSASLNIYKEATSEMEEVKKILTEIC